MASKGNSGLVVGFKGKIGPVQMSSWRGLQVLKSLPCIKKKRGKIESDVLLQRKALFRTVMGFLASIGNDMFSVGYQLKKKNAFTAMNAACSYHIQHAVTGTYPEYKIDFAQVKFSKPIREIEGGWNTEIRCRPERWIDVVWELNKFPEKTTQLDDEPVVIWYSSKQKQFYQQIGTGYQRSSMKISRQWQEFRIGDEVHCWMFFVSADKRRVSQTEYMGMIIVQP